MHVLTCGLLLAAAPAAQPPVPPKLTPADVFGVWLEARREVDGRVYTDPNDLVGWQFTARECGCWGRRGESVYSSLGTMRLRTDKTPAWLDVVGETIRVEVDGRFVEKVNVRRGIVKRDGKKLVWTWAKSWTRVDPKDVADGPGRPTAFAVRKDDPWETAVLYASAGLYTQD